MLLRFLEKFLNLSRCLYKLLSDFPLLSPNSSPFPKKSQSLLRLRNSWPFPKRSPSLLLSRNSSPFPKRS